MDFPSVCSHIPLYNKSKKHVEDLITCTPRIERYFSTELLYLKTKHGWFQAAFLCFFFFFVFVTNEKRNPVVFSVCKFARSRERFCFCVLKKLVATSLVRMCSGVDKDVSERARERERRAAAASKHTKWKKKWMILKMLPQWGIFQGFFWQCILHRVTASNTRWIAVLYCAVNSF